MTAASKKVAIIEVAMWWRFQRAEPVLTEGGGLGSDQAKCLIEQDKTDN
jgi:hypothetical protein